jgi:organic radical activating enzyme
MSDTFCPLLYTGIATDPSGGYRPCCRFRQTDSFRGSLSDYKSSEMYKKLEQDFLTGVWPKGCIDCEKNEERNGQSKRLREIANYKSKYKQELDLNHLKSIKYDLVDLRLSNKCNLGCLSCNPKSSSLIFDELKKHTDDHLKHMEIIFNGVKELNLTTPYPDKEINKLFDCVDKTSRIYFTGGEPSIVKGALKFLQRLIDEGYNETVVLEFNSNFQTYNPKFIDLLSHFPNGLMLPSIDAIGTRAEYIRYPSDWNQIQKNIKLFTEKCPTWKMRFAPTISILNIFYLDELVEFCKKNNYDYSFINILFGPEYFNITIMPDKWKDIALEKLKHIPEANGIRKYIYSKETNLDRLQACRTNLNRGDKIRNNDFRKVLPELMEMFNECL